jgi:hypothetical protein
LKKGDRFFDMVEELKSAKVVANDVVDFHLENGEPPLEGG